jgi:hypothetical protein
MNEPRATSAAVHEVMWKQMLQRESRPKRQSSGRSGRFMWTQMEVFAGGGRVYHRLYSTQEGPSHILVLFSAGSRNMFKKHVPTVEGMLANARFGLAPTPVASVTPSGGSPGHPDKTGAATSAGGRIPLEPGRIVGGQPVGLFCKYIVTAFGSSRVDARTWLFLPGNRISRVYPYDGAFDPSRCSNDTCGTYQIRGGQMSVRLDNGTVIQWAFAASAEGIRLDGDLYRPARPMTTKSLVGRWADGGARGAIGSNIYTFDGNGRFSFGTSSSALPGTHQVQGLTLTLKFANGDVRRRTLFALSAGTPVGLISVDSDVYARK